MSLTITGIIVALLSWVVKITGVEMGTEEITQFVNTFGELIGILLAWYGRWRQGDIGILGNRKKA